MFLTFTPPINILPSVTSANLAISLASVVFPPPEGPTNATCSPAFILRLTSCSASFAAPGYLNETFSNVIDVSAGCFLSAVCSNGFLSIILLIRESASSTTIVFSPAYIIFVSVTVIIGVIII